MAHIVRDDDDIPGLAARVAALEAAVERLTQALVEQRPITVNDARAAMGLPPAPAG